MTRVPGPEGNRVSRDTKLLFQLFGVTNSIGVDIIIKVGVNTPNLFDMLLYPLCPILQSRLFYDILILDFWIR